jgi:hypothetical protein
MPKKEVPEMCETVIRKEIGSVDDIPYKEEKGSNPYC